MATHHPTLAIVQPVPQEIDAGTAFVLNVRVSCADGCDLRGAPIQVVAADGVVTTSELAAFADSAAETGDIAVTSPAASGEHVWTVLFPRHEAEAVVHDESRLEIAFTTRPHATSMAVWDVPSPVVMNRPFKVKVGVKCSAACQLGGRLVMVCDEEGTVIGEGRFGDTPWPGTSALHVADVELLAPATEGIPSWSARFVATAPGLPHEDALSAFTFRTGRPPAHRVSVRVADKETNAPIDGVDVRLGAYRGSTNADGLASLELPQGVYDVDAWKMGYEVTPRRVEVASDLTVQVDAVRAPERNPDDERVWM